ncbi:pirin family protein [Hymenobacter yonginensis]|uniref:Quercetin 2,3-dioxygenase C-terminal cupin domain-containing protein n=1 Tax=Hymenobacter yonginensis TaxID=748197 RepID=A0ABY7PNP8_9BACT|nr:hypothetical protein [Hymenobacter yonginensis]WBO84875.1 hypothetical protein O9Z63_01215 [Hymenobacter yonginensis]
MPGKIFLADQRQHQETAEFRRFSTFHASPAAGAGHMPFGALQGLHEETLAAGSCTTQVAEAAGWVLVLPVTGSVAVHAATDPYAMTVQVEELLLLPVAAGTVVELRNPYSDCAIQLLHLWLAGPAPRVAGAARLFPFRFADLANCLAPVVAGPPVRVALGQLAGRQEVEYVLTDSAHSFFAVVLAGAFEVAGRLLHQHDALGLWDTPRVELEALSYDAVVLVLELPSVPAS